MSSFFKIFDIFGNSFTPTVGYSSKQESLFGGILGLIFFIFSIYLIYDFGKNIIDKKVPITSQSVDVSLLNNINLTMPFALKLKAQNDFGYAVNKTQANIDLDYLNNNLDRLFTVTTNYMNTKGERPEMKFKPCNMTDFGSYIYPNNETILGLNCTDYQDMEENTINLIGKSGDPSHSEIQYDIFVCENSTVQNNCFSPDERDYYFNNYKFKQLIYYPGLVFNPQNYTHPFDYYVDFTQFFLFTRNNFMIKQSFNILNFELNTDNGLFYQENFIIQAQQLESSEYYIQSENKFFDSGSSMYKTRLLYLAIQVSKNTFNFYRSYEKVQDVVANVLGITGIIMFFGQMFMQRIYDSKTNELIIHQVFNIREEDILKDHESDNSNENEDNNKEINQSNKKDTANYIPNLKIKGISDKNYIDINNERKTSMKNLIVSNYKIKYNDNNENDNDNDNDNVNNHNENHYKLDYNNPITINVDKLSSLKVKDVGENQNNNNNSKVPNDIPNKNYEQIDNNLDNISENKPNTNQKLNNSNEQINNLKNNHQNNEPNSIELNSFNSVNINEYIKNLANKENPNNSYSFEKNLDKKEVYSGNITNTKTNKTKTKYSFKDEDDMLLSLWDHFMLTYLCCCVFGKTKIINDYYEKVRPLARDYTDILNISYNIYEMEKLKYLLFDEEQIALFNLRSKVNVTNKNIANTNFTKFYYYTKELDDEIPNEQLKIEIELREKQKVFNERLVNLVN